VPLAIVARELGGSASAAIDSALTGRVSVRLKCPACRALMAEARIEDTYGVDVCRRCQLLWLDAGERTQVARDSLPALDRDDRAALAARGKTDLARWVMAERAARLDRIPSVPAWRLVLGYFGLPVLASEHRVAIVPLVTLLLATLMTLGTWLHHESASLAQLLGFDSADPLRMGGLTVLTSFMLHGGVLHWLGNLYFWLMVAASAEQLLGSARLLVLCLVACASSALADWLLPRHSVSIGASGVVAALLVFFALALPHARVALFFWPLVYRGRSGWVHLPVGGALALWLVGQVWGLVGQLSGFGRVSYAAHLGGALTGAIAFLWWRAPQSRKSRLSVRSPHA
jgi:membrane associated rhomboid family serine protease